MDLCKSKILSKFQIFRFLFPAFGLFSWGEFIKWKLRFGSFELKWKLRITWFVASLSCINYSGSSERGLKTRDVLMKTKIPP